MPDLGDEQAAGQAIAQDIGGSSPHWRSGLAETGDPDAAGLIEGIARAGDGQRVAFTDQRSAHGVARLDCQEGRFEDGQDPAAALRIGR